MQEFNACAALHPNGPLEPFSFDPGPLGPEEVEIKVSHCGLCHSDLSMLDNEWGMSQYPFVPGHEVTGTVVALGEAVKGLKIGQRVGLGWSAHSCLSCHECLSGDQHLCATAQGTIVGRHGGFADRVRAQWPWVRPLPDNLDLAKVGPLLCGGITVFAPFLIHNVPSTARVGIIGIGGLGHMALQFANKWGCEVHAFSLILGQRSVSGSPTGSPTAIDHMLEFSARHSVGPVVEYFPMSKVNDALERLRSGKARYRIVLINDLAKSQAATESGRAKETEAALSA